MSEEKVKHGGISVETEHIFPIIKKWLYSEKEIFIREIISNACDAVTKMKRLTSLGQANAEDDYKITVTLDKTAKTITVSDNGIGMNEAELEKYICQMALSGALDFIKKYEGESEGAGSGIIGHFGLGFYSSFMVSETVDIVTKSFDGSPAVKWVCNDAGEYEISEGDRDERGTDIVMHISSEGDEFLDAAKLRAAVEKYCAFMPVEIYFEEAKDEDEEKADDKPEEKEKKPINDTHPLWLKNPSECTDDEYKDFYRKVFSDWRDPLFYIHLNADYPLNFKGILYFPRIVNEYDSLEGQVKLYYNQVFVADNIKEVIPEFLLMLKGVLDCPELPLNVSRSYLQNNGYVAKISAHIIKKVSDKLNSMFTSEREKYEKQWRDLKTFVEYGCLRDHKFYGRVKNSVLYETTDGSFATLDEYLEAAKETNENTVYYAADKVAQAQYINMFTSAGIKVALLDRLIDTQFIQIVEADRSGIKFVRVDADVAGALKADGEATENAALADLYKAASGNDKLTVKFERLKDAGVPAVLNISEQSRRIDDMMKMYAMTGDTNGAGAFSTEATLIVNTSSPLTEKLATLCGGTEDDKAKAARISKEIWTLCLLSHRRLTADELKEFLADSYGLLEAL